MFETYIGYIITGLTALGTVVGVITSILQNIKARANEKIAIQAQNALDILSVVNDAVVKAEELLTNGTTKKAIATSTVINYAVKNHIDVNEDYIGNIIDSVVAITKKINKRDKDNVVVEITEPVAEEVK